MAIVTEYPYKGRTDRIKHYSDIGYTVIQNETGIEYGEAIDIYPCPYTYSEGNLIETESTESTEIDYETAYNEITEVLDGDTE